MHSQPAFDRFGGSPHKKPTMPYATTILKETDSVNNSIGVPWCIALYRGRRKANTIRPFSARHASRDDFTDPEAAGRRLEESTSDPSPVSDGKEIRNLCLQFGRQLYAI